MTEHTEDQTNDDHDAPAFVDADYSACDRMAQ